MKYEQVSVQRPVCPSCKKGVPDIHKGRACNHIVEFVCPHCGETYGMTKLQAPATYTVWSIK